MSDYDLIIKALAIYGVFSLIGDIQIAATYLKRYGRKAWNRMHR